MLIALWAGWLMPAHLPNAFLRKMTDSVCNKICSTAFFLFFFSVCLNAGASAAESGAAVHKGLAGKESGSNGAEATAGVTDLLNMQAQAWNHADLDTFVSGYLRSPRTSYVSSDSEVWGYDALRDRYQGKYGDKHDTMGNLKFSDLKVQDLGRHNALCIGRWHLERSEKPPVDGIFSLVLVKTNAGWKIMHDHTSVCQEAGQSKAKS